MSAYLKKHAKRTSFLKDLFKQKTAITEKILQNSMNKQQPFWWILFLTFKKQMLICALLQIISLILVLVSPFVIKYYLGFFSEPINLDFQVKFITLSLYFFSFAVLLITAFYLKKRFMIHWERSIEFQTFRLISQFCCFSKRNNNIFLKKYVENYGDIFSNKLAEFPNIFSLFFSIPSIIVAFFFIYSLMDKLFLIPLCLLLLMFLFQIKNQIYVSRCAKKIRFFLHARDSLLKKIFTYGNKVHLLSMESFFIRKIHFLQQSENKIALKILNNISASKVIYYYSGFIIAIPSVICYMCFHKNTSLISVSVLLIFFILVAHLYSNILLFFSSMKMLRKDFKFLNTKVSLVKSESNEVKLNDNDEVYENNDSLLMKQKYSIDHERILFHKASFMSLNNISLYNINFEQKNGSLIAVIGQSGCDISAFLLACTGDLNLVSGEKKIPNNFEVLPNNFSLFDGTLRENILLDRNFEGRRYIETVKSCHLEEDFNALDDGDETYLDTSKNNFKESFLKKIALARILYSKSDFYYFEEPFLGLSINEASNIFNDGILKQLKGKNRILITQKLEHAALCDLILVMKDGMIAEQGNHKSLIEKGGIYAKLHYSGAESRKFGLSFTQEKINIKNVSIDVKEKFNLYEYKNIEKSSDIKYIRQVFLSAKFFLKHYFQNKNSYISFALVLFSQIFICLAFYSLFSELTNDKFSKNFQMISFLFFSIVSMFLFYFFHLKNTLLNISLCSSIEKKVYDVLIKEYRNDQSYIASYLNKFSKVKNKLFESITAIMVRISFFLAGCFLLSITNISALLLVISIGIFTCVFFLLKKSSFIKSYFNFIKDKNEMEHVNQQLIHSLMVPNSFSFRVFLYNKLNEKINALQQKAKIKDKIFISFCKFIFLSLCFVTAISLSYFVVKLKVIHLGTIILALMSIIFFFQAFVNIGKVFRNFIKCIPYFESLLNASKQYSNNSLLYSTSEFWPQKGSLRIMSLTTKATKDYSSFIKNLDLFIPHASRFGLIAEKGQHKLPALFASLLLFVPFESGTIILDDEDLLKINSLDLKSRYSYISMDSLFPFLSLRENLDPFEEFDDSEIWSVLNRVGVAQSVAVMRNGLNTKIDEFPNQMVWSGELILFSFARALLYRNKIILIDNLIVPDDTELRIIDLIERDFTDVTIIVHAHAKSSLLTLCADVARFEEGILRRATLDKITYYTPTIQYEGADFVKNFQ